MNLFLDFILISGITIITIILYLLIKPKQKQLSRKILIVFFCLLFFVSIFSYASFQNIAWLSYISFIPNDITTLLIGPLLYLFIKSLFLKEKDLILKTLRHFVPVSLHLTLIALPTLLYSIFRVETLSYVVSENVYLILRIEDIYLIVYLIISLKLLAKYRRLLKSNYSDLSEHDYSWIKIMLSGSLLIISFYLLIGTYEIFSEDVIWYQDYLIVIAMILLVSFLGYFGVNQSKILLPDFLLEEEEPSTFECKKILFSDAQVQEFESLNNKLEVALITNKPYLDENLTLGKLAEQLGTSDKKLSTLINQRMNTTFYDLINKYRVAAVVEKMKLNSYDDYSLFGIACESGFKSRTSFGRIFKKETGLSPSAYKSNLDTLATDVDEKSILDF